MKTSRRCPCGSGRLRTECDPAELVPCVYGTGDAACTELFHRHANSSRYCDVHREVRRRERNNASYAKFKRLREERTIAEWEERMARTKPSPQQTTLDVGSHAR